MDLEPLANVNGASSAAERNVVDSRRREGARGEEEEEELENPQNKHSKLVLLVRALIGIVLFLLVLGCVTLSKLTLVSLTNQLHQAVGEYQREGNATVSDKALVAE